MKYNKSGVYVRNNIIYVQGNIDGVFYRKSTKKQATKANLLWVKKNTQSVLLQLIDKKETSKVYTLEEFGYHSLTINASNRKDNTNKDYLMMFKGNILPNFRLWKLNEIRPTDLKQWQNNLLKKGLSAGRVMNIRTVFRGILQDAFIDELIKINPFDRVKPPKKEKTIIHPFNLQEVELLISSSKGWFQNYLIVAFFTGMRIGEIMALQWKDIDFSTNVISIKRSMTKGKLSTPKTANSIREIDMLSVVKDALKNQAVNFRTKSDFVFLNQYGKNFTDASTLQRYHWKPLLQKLDIAYRILYHTRHTFASIMLQQAEEIGWVSQMMGHRDIHTTFTRYARFIPRKQKERAKFINNLKLGGEKSTQKLHTKNI